MNFLCCKQKTAYGLRISDWSSDVCSSDLEAYTSTSDTPLANCALAGPARRMAIVSARITRLAAWRGQKEPVMFGPIGMPEMLIILRSAERRVGKECVGTCRSR